MADYHPLDVRYKGPSTAYTGSAKLRKMDTPPPVKPDHPPQHRSGPWQKQPAPPQVQPAPPPPPKPAAKPRARRKKSASRVFLILSVLVIIVLSNNSVRLFSDALMLEINDTLQDVITPGTTL